MLPQLFCVDSDDVLGGVFSDFVFWSAVHAVHTKANNDESKRDWFLFRNFNETSRRGGGAKVGGCELRNGWSTLILLPAQNHREGSSLIARFCEDRAYAVVTV